MQTFQKKKTLGHRWLFRVRQDGRKAMEPLLSASQHRLLPRVTTPFAVLNQSENGKCSTALK